MLTPLAKDLWFVDQPLRFLGLEVGTRMTVVRLDERRLLLHSPVARTPELARAVEALGEPAIVVAPNRLHHLYVGEWKAAYPDCAVHVAPGLETKRADLAPAAILGSEAICEPLVQVPLTGFPFSNEVVFFHAASGTVLASDLIFNLTAENPWLTRAVMSIGGRYGRPSATIVERLLVKDRAAFRASLDRILAWPFERLVMAHGAVLETGGRAALAEAYDWLR